MRNGTFCSETPEHFVLRIINLLIVKAVKIDLCYTLRTMHHKLLAKHISHNLCVCFVLVNEVTLYVNVCHFHRFIYMV